MLQPCLLRCVYLVVIVQSPSCVQLFATPWTEALQASLSLTISQVHVRCIGVCPSSFSLHWWCHPAISSSDTLFSFCPQSFPASGTFQVVCSHQMTKILELQHQSFQWIFRIDLLTVQETFRSLLQHHSWKASIFWHSAFFTVQLSQPYMTSGKTIVLIYRPLSTEWLMSLLFNILSRFVVTFQSSSDSMAAVTVHSDFGVQEEELCDYFHLFPFYLPCNNEVGCHDLRFFNI